MFGAYIVVVLRLQIPVTIGDSKAPAQWKGSKLYAHNRSGYGSSFISSACWLPRRHSSMPSSEAEHEFGALNTLLLVVILGLCILSAYLIRQNSFYYLPESAAAIVVGIIVGGLARAVYPSTEELAFLSFEPELFFFLLLPPIIFEAGYSLEKKSFFANFWSIALYAVFGTIISTFIIGGLVYGVGLTGLVDIDTSSPMEALVFGALISAVDPVATLSIMGNPELNCDKLLYSLVFGESVLNDAGRCHVIE
jgi:sodium/hydrogen exchanger 8